MTNTIKNPRTVCGKLYPHELLINKQLVSKYQRETDLRGILLDFVSQSGKNSVYEFMML